MRIIYNKLLLASDYKEIASKSYFEDLISSIINLFPGMNGVTVKNEIDDFNIDQKILFPLGFIINELITNSMKYAFPDKYPGRIGIMMQKKENEITLTVQDNGIGLPVNFDINKSNSFGLMLVRMLSQQLKVSFFIKNNKGTKCILVFKI